MLFCDREIEEIGAVAFVVGDTISNNVVGVRCEGRTAKRARPHIGDTCTSVHLCMCNTEVFFGKKCGVEFTTATTF